MDSIKDILKNFNPTQDKYISREYQSYGVHLAQRLNDERRTALYIKFAKTIPRPVLEKALSFVSDSNARNVAALFMWKLKDLNAFAHLPGESTKKRKRKTSKKKDAETVNGPKKRSKNVDPTLFDSIG